jgi:hypothetical protein
MQQHKRAQYLTHLSLPPYSIFPAELASILLLAFSPFELVTVLSQCLRSERPYLSINCTVLTFLHEYHVIYSVWYYPRFHVIAVGLGTYYAWIRGHCCTVHAMKAYRKNGGKDPLILILHTAGRRVFNFMSPPLSSLSFNRKRCQAPTE